VPDALHSPNIVDHCFDVFRKMVPMHIWLREMAERARGATV